MPERYARVRVSVSGEGWRAGVRVGAKYTPDERYVRPVSPPRSLWPSWQLRYAMSLIPDLG